MTAPRLTEEQRIAIARDPRPQQIVAQEWKISRSYVRTLRQRCGCAVDDHRGPRGPRIAREEPPRRVLPVRHYKPASWDLEPSEAR